MQAAAPSPEQQWENMMARVVERANGIPDTRALKIDLQEGLLLLQRLKDQMVSTRDESIKVWQERAQKAEARVKELETKYEVQPKPERSVNVDPGILKTPPIDLSKPEEKQK